MNKMNGKLFNAKWSVSYSDKIYRESQRFMGWTSCVFLPTIEYFRDTTFNDDDDYSFQITFEWLFWHIKFTRYWGKTYLK